MLSLGGPKLSLPSRLSDSFGFGRIGNICHVLHGTEGNAHTNAMKQYQV